MAFHVSVGNVILIMADNKKETEAPEPSVSISERIRQFVDKYIFPGKLFPCYRNRIGEDGEILPPPTISELLTFEADNAKGKRIIEF